VQISKWILYAFLVSGAAQAQVYKVALDHPTAVRAVGDVSLYVNSIDLSPAGDALLLDLQKNNSPRVFEMTSQGHSLHQLSPDTDPPAERPKFAPDGRSILFVERRFPSTIMSVDLAWRTKVSIVAGYEPSESHDGSRIVFTNETDANPIELYIAKLDGTSVQHIVRQSGSFFVSNPSFDPKDPRHIIYSDGSRGIAEINSDASGYQLILKDSNAVEPNFSADGSEIIYATSATSGPPKFDIFLMKSDGTQNHRITNVPGVWCRNPVLSPDGQTVYFIEYRGAAIEHFQRERRLRSRVRDAN
jgi:Tol biopolymer transport system component